jgi:hypothetical protein
LLLSVLQWSAPEVPSAAKRSLQQLVIGLEDWKTSLKLADHAFDWYGTCMQACASSAQPVPQDCDLELPVTGAQLPALAGRCKPSFTSLHLLIPLQFVKVLDLQGACLGHLLIVEVVAQLMMMKQLLGSADTSQHFSMPKLAWPQQQRFG